MAEHGTVKYLLLTLADEVVNQKVDDDIILIQVENIREMLAAHLNIACKHRVFFFSAHGVFTPHAEAVWQRVAGAEQKRQCCDHFGTSLFLLRRLC